LTKLLIDKGAKNIFKSNNEKYFALEYCLNNSKTELAEYFLKKGDNINSLTFNGQKPMLYLIRKNDMANLKLLIQYGADINIEEKTTKPTEGELKKIIPYTIESDTALTLAIKLGQISLSEMLIDNGANVNALLSVGYTPLMVAIRAKDIAIIELLLKSGANPDLTGKYQDTPLCTAIESHNLPLIKILVQYKANVNLSGRNNRHPLLLACMVRDINIFDYLIGMDAKLQYSKLEKTNHHSNSEVRSLIIQKKESECIKLLQEGFDPNGTVWDSEGNEDDSLLVTAIRFELEELVQEMIIAGAKVNESPCFSAFEVATQHNLTCSILMLIAAGANLNLPSAKNNLTENGRKDILSIIEKYQK